MPLSSLRSLKDTFGGSVAIPLVSIWLLTKLIKTVWLYLNFSTNTDNKRGHKKKKGYTSKFPWTVVGSLKNHQILHSEPIVQFSGQFTRSFLGFVCPLFVLLGDLKLSAHDIFDLGCGVTCVMLDHYIGYPFIPPVVLAYDVMSLVQKVLWVRWHRDAIKLKLTFI